MWPLCRRAWIAWAWSDVLAWWIKVCRLQGICWCGRAVDASQGVKARSVAVDFICVGPFTSGIQGAYSPVGLGIDLEVRLALVFDGEGSRARLILEQVVAGLSRIPCGV